MDTCTSRLPGAARALTVALALALAAVPGVASAGTVTNARTGLANPTLGGAILGALANDTLIVDGALTEAVTVDKSLTIVGNPGASITSSAAKIFTVNAGVALTIDGLFVDGTGNTQGIVATGGANLIVVTNSRFSTGSTLNNVHGGGIQAQDPLLVLLEDVVFESQPGVIAATLGGGVYVDSTLVYAPVMLTDVVFDELKTTNNGGAIWGQNTDITCTNCSFDHVIGGFGGAIYANGGSLVVERSDFCGGQGSLGGAIFSTSAVSITSSLFVEGKATTNGGALFGNGGTWTIVNNEFIGITGLNAIRMPINANLLAFENNLVWSNPGARAVDLTPPLGTQPNVRYNWFHNNGGNAAGFVLDGTNITAGGDPRVVSWTPDNNCANDSLWPAIGSPLINAGDPLILDLDGTRSDIGAFGGPGADGDVFDDADGDGVIKLYDCNDQNATVYPGHAELCDLLDNDCDGQVDEQAIDVDDWHEDCDRDGQGKVNATATGCFAPATPPACGGAWLSGLHGGLVADADCNDNDASVYTGAPERCLAGDQNCDGDDNLGAVDMQTYYTDADADGYGLGAVSACASSQPAGTVSVGGDCDDASAATHPGAADACGDGIDQSCDGFDGLPADLVDWFADVDGDGYGDPNGIPLLDCRPGAGQGWVADDTDCDVADPTVHPGATETCDGVDQDCNGLVDDTGAATTWYLDADADGFGDDAIGLSSDCQPPGYVGASGDCDDTDATVNPAANEVCDGRDEDCDGAIDDAGAPTDWHPDADGDLHGDGLLAVSAACQPGGYVADGTDCDDASPTVFPGAPESCNGIDDDCDGTVDDTGSNETWYADADSDGYGDPSSTVSAACQPAGAYVANGLDCDDADGGVHPSAVETCDGRDEDCDGTVDDAGPLVPWYADADLDGFGDPNQAVSAACSPAGTVADATDCDDADPAVNPGADEVCNGIDDDCDGATDNTGAAIAWHADADADGFGDPLATVTADCQPAGTVADATDCDDADPTVHPAATEVCDGRDEDCDGTVDDTAEVFAWHLDADGDAFGDPAVQVSASCAPTGYVADGTDCDDTRATVFPGAAEVCDGLDDDCDGAVDDTGSPSTWYTDADLDGFGDLLTADTADCPPAATGYVQNGLDCDDSDAEVHPGAAETCDGVDDDRDGAIDNTGAPFTWFADADTDGFGDPANATSADCAPIGYSADATDCDDGDAGVHPGAAETCDGVDQDCDGTVDNTGAPQARHADADADGFGDPLSAISADCQPTGAVSDGSDCDDTDASIHPGASDACNGTDDDCDGAIDGGGALVAWFVDGDADGFGWAGSSVTAGCQPPGTSPTVTTATTATLTCSPGATEVCDGVDNDCDGTVDDLGSAGRLAGYADEGASLAHVQAEYAKLVFHRTGSYAAAAAALGVDEDTLRALVEAR